MSKQKRQPNKDGLCFREAEVHLVRSGEGENAVETVRLSVSSEQPYYRNFMWDERTKDYVHGYEVLGHAEGEVDFTRMKDGLVIQDTHYGDQIGLMRNPEIIDGKLCGDVEFCCGERAQEIKRDALAGLRRNMSVGYRVLEYKMDGEAEDGEPIYRAVKWMPHEASFVNCPADTAVGVGRSGADYENPTGGVPAAVKKMETKYMDPNQVVECFRLAKAGNVEHAEVQELIKSGKTFDEVREVLVGKLEKYQAELRERTEKAEKAASKPETPAGGTPAGVVDEGARKEIAQKYSLAKVMRALAGERVDIGYEREISQEMESKTGRKAQGIIIPDFIRAAANGADGGLTLGTPAFNADTASGGVAGVGGTGSATIATNLLAGSFIEALRDALVLSRVGMQTLSGLVGDIAIPKGGKLTAGWITAENGDASKTNPTFGQASATPHTCGSYVDITRKLLLQSSIDVQGFVVRELVYAIAHALESAGFNGTGNNGEPLGIMSQITQTVAFTAGAPTLAKLLEMVSKIDEANGVIGAQTFVGRPSVWALLGSTIDWNSVSGEGGTVGGVTSGRHLLDTATNTCQGYPFVKSNIAPAKQLVFGAFDQLVLCLWSGTDLLVDQYSQCTKGALRVVALQDADFICRQPAAFAKGTTLLA
jgi:HK97 family phage major capsid protein